MPREPYLLGSGKACGCWGSQLGNSGGAWSSSYLAMNMEVGRVCILTTGPAALVLGVSPCEGFVVADEISMVK